MSGHYPGVPKVTVRTSPTTGMNIVVVIRATGFSHEVYRSPMMTEATLVANTIRISLASAYEAGQAAFTEEQLEPLVGLAYRQAQDHEVIA